MSKLKKAAELVDFRVDEVSFVGKGANMKRVFLLKNQNGEEINMKNLAEIFKNFKFSDEAKTEKQLDDICKAEHLNEGQRASLKTALAVIENMEGEGVRGFHFSVDEDYASVSVYKGEEEKPPEEKPAEKPPEEKPVEKPPEEKPAEKPPEETPAADVEKSAELKEKDAQIEALKALVPTSEKSAVNKILKIEEKVEKVPEAVQKQLDDLAAENKKLKSEKADDSKEIKKAKDEKLAKEFVEKAKNELSNLAGSEELGTVLKKLNDVLSTEEYENIENIFKQAHIRIEKGDLFKEVGTNHTSKDELDGEALVDKVAKDLVEANPKISIQKARIQARAKIAKDTNK